MLAFFMGLTLLTIMFSLGGIVVGIHISTKLWGLSESSEPLWFKQFMNKFSKGLFYSFGFFVIEIMILIVIGVKGL